MKLNLYKINYGSPSPQRDGFAFVLATDVDVAKTCWAINITQRFVQQATNASQDQIDNVKKNWLEQWISTEEVEGPYPNGFVICNVSE